MRVSAIVLAAGSGKRMGKICHNKVYLALGKYPVLSYSLRAFDNAPEVVEIICVYKHQEMKLLNDSLSTITMRTPVKAVVGGASRQESVLKGVAAVDIASDYIAIHDGARPFLNRSLLNRLFKEVQISKAAIPAIPVKDTIKEIVNNRVINTLNRSNIYAVQTPQIFHKSLLPSLSKGVAVTDDASLIEGEYPVTTVEGERYNIKITTPEDIWFAETIIRKVEEYQWLKQDSD